MTERFDFHTFAVDIPDVGRAHLRERNGECLTFKMYKIMATPIAPTPILNAEESERLYEMIDNVKPVSPEERERMKRNYEYIRSIATFELPECNW